MPKINCIKKVLSKELYEEMEAMAQQPERKRDRSNESWNDITEAVLLEYKDKVSYNKLAEMLTKCNPKFKYSRLIISGKVWRMRQAEIRNNIKLEQS